MVVFVTMTTACTKVRTVGGTKGRGRPNSQRAPQVPGVSGKIRAAMDPTRLPGQVSSPRTRAEPSCESSTRLPSRQLFAQQLCKQHSEVPVAYDFRSISCWQVHSMRLSWFIQGDTLHHFLPRSTLTLRVPELFFELYFRRS